MTYTRSAFAAHVVSVEGATPVSIVAVKPAVQDGRVGLAVSFADTEGPLGKLFLDAMLVADLLVLLRRNLAEAIETL